jgi:hypothetical protein
VFFGVFYEWGMDNSQTLPNRSSLTGSSYRKQNENKAEKKRYICVMKAKLLSQLNPEELSKYEGSLLYKDYVMGPYQYTKYSLAFYDDYYLHEFINFSIVVFDELQEPFLVLYAYSKNPGYSHFGLPVSIIEVPSADTLKKNKAHKILIAKLQETIQVNGFEDFVFYHNDFLCAEYLSKITTSETEYNCYVDLSLPEEVIKTNIRKSYKSLVNWGEKNLRICLIDHANPDYKKFNEFKDFHFAVSGRKTRSDRSWDLQFESIKSKEAFLVLGYLNDQLVSGSLVLYGKKTAYYGVGVYDRELMAKNIAVGHYVVLYSIYHAKRIGLQSIKLGYMSNSSTDEKEKNIYKFKAGFSNTVRIKNRHFVSLK